MAVAVVVAALAIAAAAIAIGGSGGSTADDSSQKKVKVALIVKTFTNPYFVAMRNQAREAAKEHGVELTVSAGVTGADTAPQITAIQNAVAAKYDGILIVLNGPAVNKALRDARKAGLYTIALDTPPSPPNLVNITYATDNKQAGLMIGKYAAAKLDGRHARIALLDALATQVVSVDVDRNHGFLEGMGIPVGSPNINGKAPKSGRYTGGKGGTYRIACEEATDGLLTKGKSVMQTCLQKDRGINLVYAVNEQSAQGATQALKADGNDATVVTIDGGCSALPDLANGSISATAAQFPGKMAAEGVRAIHKLITERVQPRTSRGLAFFNTGVRLFTDGPQPGVPSVDVAAAKKLCW